MFKPGDRVRVISVCGGTRLKIGDVGTVMENYDDTLTEIQTDEGIIGKLFHSRFELISTFEVGKRYSIQFTVLHVGEEYAFFNSDGIGEGIIPLKSFKEVLEVKSEDWRCLHYVNNIASLGGESFSSKEEVEKKFSSSPNFITAVRVDD